MLDENIKDDFIIQRVLKLLKKTCALELNFTFESLMKMDISMLEEIEKFVDEYSEEKDKALKEFKKDNKLE